MNRIYKEEMRIISDVGFKLTFCEEIERFVSTTLEGDVGVSFSARAQSTTKGGKGRQKKKKKRKEKRKKKNRTTDGVTLLRSPPLFPTPTETQEFITGDTRCKSSRP